MTAHHNDWDTSAQMSESSSSITSSSDSEIVALKAEMAEINKNVMKMIQTNQQVKAVTPSCETCGGPNDYNDCNRNLLSYCSDNYLGPPGFNQNQNRSNQNQNYQNRNHGNNHGKYQGNNQGRNQFFQGASHVQNPPSAYQAPARQSPGYQAPVHQAPIPQPQVVTTTEFTNYMKANDAILKNMQTNMTSLTNSNLELKNMFGQFMKINTTSSSGSGTLPSNTITNPREDLKGITTRSGVAYKGPTIPTTSSSLKVVERETEVTKDTVPPTNNGSTKDVQPSVVQVETQVPNSEPVVAPVVEPIEAPVSAPKPNPKLSIPYPSRLNDQKLGEKANNQMEKNFKIFQDLHFDISFADALILMPKFTSTIKSLLSNKEKMFELATTPLNEHCSAVLLKKLPKKLGDPDKFLIPCDFPGMDVCLALADLSDSINLMPLSVLKKLSLPELTPTCMTLKLTDRSISLPIGVADDVFIKVGMFHFPADFVVVDFDVDPRVPLILRRSFLKTGHALIDVYAGELTLRVGNKAVTFNLDQTSRYSSNYDDISVNRIDVCNIPYFQVMLKYGVTHRLATAYHPQTSGQVEVSNRGLKRILERTVGENRASWSDKLEDALWAFYTAFKTPIECTPYKLVYGKACHLPIELEHKAYWALKHANFDLKSTGKLKTRWTGPFTVAQVFPYGTVELSQTNGLNFKDCLDFEASSARGFVLRSLELQILSFIMGIQYPNLIN
ncbi:reverse transcriptase domain-containing protein [Tanacetum coccineum]